MNRIRAERLRFFTDLLDADLQLRNAKIALLEQLGVSDLSTPFDVAEILGIRPLQLSPQDLQAQALQARPDLLAETAKAGAKPARPPSAESRSRPQRHPVLRLQARRGREYGCFRLECAVAFLQSQSGRNRPGHSTDHTAAIRGKPFAARGSTRLAGGLSVPTDPRAKGARHGARVCPQRASSPGHRAAVLSPRCPRPNRVARPGTLRSPSVHTSTNAATNFRNDQCICVFFYNTGFSGSGLRCAGNDWSPIPLALDEAAGQRLDSG